VLDFLQLDHPSTVNNPIEGAAPADSIPGEAQSPGREGEEIARQQVALLRQAPRVGRLLYRKREELYAR